MPINRIFSPGRAVGLVNLDHRCCCLSVLVVGDLAPVKDVDSHSLFGWHSLARFLLNSQEEGRRAAVTVTEGNLSE